MLSSLIHIARGFFFLQSGVRFPLSDKRKSHRYALYLQDASARRHHYVTMTTTDDFFLPPEPTNKAWLFSDVQYMAGCAFLFGFINPISRNFSEDQILALLARLAKIVYH